MSDSPAQISPRPVSLFTVLAIFAAFAFFFFLVYKVYLPRQTGAYSGDGIRTAAERTEILKKLRETQEAQIANPKYTWADQPAGIVRLPMDRAIELTVQQYGTKK